MSETNPITTAAKEQKQPDAIPAAALDWSVGPLLNAQADLLAGAEATVIDWLHRRHEAVLDTQQLIAHMHTGTDPADALKAQREWMSRSFRRLAADADAYHSVSRQLMDRAVLVSQRRMDVVFTGRGEYGERRVTSRGHARDGQAITDG